MNDTEPYFLCMYMCVFRSYRSNRGPTMYDMWHHLCSKGLEWILVV